MEITAQRPGEARTFLDALGSIGSVFNYKRADSIFYQGDLAENIWFIHKGQVRLSVVSSGGREAVVGMLTDGAFFGEESLASPGVHRETATVVAASTLRVVPSQEMRRLLLSQPAFSERFIGHMLARTARLEADLADQLTNPLEKRLARTLMLLASEGGDDRRVSPNITQEVLARMVGSTRARVNLFLGRFKKCGFIEDDGGIRIRHSLQDVLLSD